MGTSGFGVRRALGGFDVERVLGAGGFVVCGEVAGCLWCGKGSGWFGVGRTPCFGVGRALGAGGTMPGFSRPGVMQRERGCERP